MPRWGVCVSAPVVLLLAAATFAVAHGETSKDGTGEESPWQDDASPRSYWSLAEYATLMYWHIALEILAWVVILPVAVMLSIARSRLVLPSQIAFLVINALALVLGVVYDHRTPELYAHNSHSKTGWAVTWIASAWVFLTLIQVYMGWRNETMKEVHPIDAANMERYQCLQQRLSNDSGQGTERNSASLDGHSRCSSMESEELAFVPSGREHTLDEFSVLNDESEKGALLDDTFIDRFMTRNVACLIGKRTVRATRILHVIIERTILLQGIVAVANGTVVYGGIGRGGAVFNVLAHYVKGGIFFVYGILTLGRWVGVFADLGWAWNVKPTRGSFGSRRWTVPSAEFTESFVIWLYGVTNVFLEHLAAWGDEWTAQDLEHVSISVMFFGGGLLGMIVESRKMRDLLNYTVASSHEVHPTDEAWKPPRQYPFSMNPVPALIIMLPGKMMSAHHQDSMLSTTLHGQWGSMFMGFAIARGLTYTTLYISPPSSFLPSRPPTDLIAAFCLISGGITFIASNKDTVAILDAYQLDAMFTFTLTMGLTALLMAWATMVIAIKGWVVRRESGDWYAKCQAGVLA